ncbi:SH3 domain-containing protein [Chryseobacterium sp. ISL-6]|uniref:SH3 domain-containing protein n=1 Tax=Chryseobacterium sp. ISL-6 TaxID=2819143 RepID=UPI001BE8C8E4|nr:SH3 domain-containing protein [Chryseobacterium sp. ISL-6]MBT2621371.1 SH3 domain-containing protein [Chryseobacterium sp. ISL-6]
MKTFIFIITLCLGALVSDSFSTFKPDKTIHGGRCTGSANCSACSNCSGCGHCAGGGGSCGVCKGGSYEKKYSSKKDRSKKSRDSNPYTPSQKGKSTKAPPVFVNEININSSRYIAGIAVTHVYEKPSVKSKIIEIVPKNEKLIQLSKQDSWYKVKAQKTGKTGYVYYKDVK